MPRPRKPTNLHVLEGTFRKDRHEERKNEPRPVMGAVMPSALEKVPGAAEHWKAESPELERLGVLTKVDARAFGRLCVLWAWEDQSAAGLRAPLSTALLAEIRQLEDRFGMNPSSRAKLSTGEPEKAEGKLDKFRKGTA